MFDGIWLSLKVWRLERDKQHAFKKYMPLLIVARAKNDHNEIDSIALDEVTEIDQIDDEINQLQSNYLYRRARKFFLPIPEFGSKGSGWEQSEISGKWRLSKAAFADLRSKIRAEEKERREPWQSAVIWVTATTGLIGALTGLIAALHSHSN